MTSARPSDERSRLRAYAVETTLHGRWFTWSVHIERKHAWESMRSARGAYPLCKFRTRRYGPVKS